jgi:hypothetical protein
MDQVLMAIQATLFITRPRINHRPMRQHSTPFVGNIEKIVVTFLAEGIFRGFVNGLSVLLVIVDFLGKVTDQISHSVINLHVVETRGIGQWRKMAIHTLGDEAFSIIHVSGGLPGLASKSNLVTRRTESGTG